MSEDSINANHRNSDIIVDSLEEAVVDLEPRVLFQPEFAVVHGISTGKRAGVFGSSVRNVGVWGKSEQDYAGKFEGNIQVVGDIEVSGDIRLTNADCAEEFDVVEGETIEPGTVMVIGNDGVIMASSRPYDKRVAGVISGAGCYKPGIVLDKQVSENERKPVALLGKVYCKVDSQYGAIEVGDLLTTSPSRGYAMKASDPIKALGAVLGKALSPFSGGQGVIPIIVLLS